MMARVPRGEQRQAQSQWVYGSVTHGVLVSNCIPIHAITITITRFQVGFGESKTDEYIYRGERKGDKIQGYGSKRKFLFSGIHIDFHTNSYLVELTLWGEILSGYFKDGVPDGLILYERKGRNKKYSR